MLDLRLTLILPFPAGESQHGSFAKQSVIRIGERKKIFHRIPIHISNGGTRYSTSNLMGSSKSK